MRGTSSRALAAAVLAPVLVVAGLAGPARADDGDAVGKVGDVVVRLFLDLSDGGLSPAEIAQLIAEATGAVRDAEAEVIAHMDAVAAAPSLGAARRHIMEFKNIAVFDEDHLWHWAMDVTGEAYDADAVFRSLSDRRAANDVGYAVNTLFPISLTARAAVGLPTTDLLATYRGALEAIVAKLEPVCRSAQGELDPHPSIDQIVHTCTAPDGRTLVFQDYRVGDRWIDGPYTAESLKEAAGARTSWSAARMALQRMNEQQGAVR